MRLQSTIRLSAALTLAAAAAFAQQPPVIRTETKLVLVDVVVTGKKGVYVEDLEMKNFKVWEDNKEQQLKTFSTGSDPNALPVDPTAADTEGGPAGIFDVHSTAPGNGLDGTPFKSW